MGASASVASDLTESRCDRGGRRAPSRFFSKLFTESQVFPKRNRLPSWIVRNFFKGISFSSIFAGALAAVTSFLLSAKIGIAGSVIGVAAGSIVSAVATQVYKNVLKASGEKLQSAVPFVGNDKNDAEDTKDKDGKANDATTVIAPVASEGDKTTTMPAADADQTQVLSADDDDATRTMSAASGRVISSAQADGRETHLLPEDSVGGRSNGQIQHAGRRAALNAWLHGKYAPIVIAIVSALIGVAVSAGLILAFTGGHGTDTVVRDVVNNSKQTPSSDDDDDSTYGTGDGTQDDTQNQSGTTDTDEDTSKTTTKNSGKDTGKKTDSSTGGTGSSTTDSGSSTKSDTNDSSKTDTSTDSNQSSSGSIPSTDSGQNTGTSNGSNGSTDTSQNQSQTGTTSNGTSSDTSGSGTGSTN